MINPGLNRSRCYNVRDRTRETRTREERRDALGRQGELVVQVGRTQGEEGREDGGSLVPCQSRCSLGRTRGVVRPEGRRGPKTKTMILLEV